MAKRFVDSDIFKKRWWRKLPPRMKLFYFYMLTQCDHAGMYDVDLELAEFQIGMPVLKKEIDEHLKDHIMEIKEDKWFIKRFPEFQYGVLNPNVKAHASVIKILTRYNCLETVPNSLEGVKDKDKVKSKVKEKVKNDAINKRCEAFSLNVLAEGAKCTPMIDPKTIEAFIDYWTEKNKSKTKMRFELQNTWDTKRRLQRWVNNNFDKKENVSNFQTDSTGRFYLAWCEVCGSNEAYSQVELGGDSRCCNGKLLPQKLKNGGVANV